MNTPARIYSVALPRGFLPYGLVVKLFTSVSAFDGYLAEMRRRGLSVQFSTPQHATVGRFC